MLDPAGREQLISVGAAVFNLRLALRRAGFCTDVAFFPDATDDELVARVVVTHAAAVTATVEALAAAIVHRHTNRQPYAHTPVPPDVLDLLRDAARTEGAVLAVTNPAAGTPFWRWLTWRTGGCEPGPATGRNSPDGPDGNTAATVSRRRRPGRGTPWSRCRSVISPS
ncbi:hypothetical protein Ari01nite_92450 [Paractinoplanes rishiriensis]|uniref:Uncharacterized protein n=1 Tax=Paractinoplanes rishiriensis TaxID=1050105 RepID=A0A919N1L6_9ACTN|nr:hypothetical protein Ari01nite_92450 [Actinoplanes rishiriensis]